MGSMLKFDSERRELVRERRQARLERKHARRQARQEKHAAEITPAAPAATVTEAMSSQTETPAAPLPSVPANMPVAAMPSAPVVVAERQRSRPVAPAPSTQSRAGQQPRTTPAVRPTARPTSKPAPAAPRVSRREPDLAAFAQHRRELLALARSEARERLARGGEPATVADALAALAMPAGAPWTAQHQTVSQALQSGRVDRAASAARKALWTVSRDAARTSRRARTDPELALAVCVAYAILAAVPRTAVASVQRTSCPAAAKARTPRAFWR